MKRAGQSTSVLIMGLGVVGSGVVKALEQKSALITQQIGRSVHVTRVLVRNLDTPRSLDVPKSILTTDPADILDDPQVHLVVALLGGESPAFDFLRQALEPGNS